MSKEITAVLVVVSVLVNVTCLIGGFISVKKRQSILLFSGLGIALGVNVFTLLWFGQSFFAGAAIAACFVIGIIYARAHKPDYVFIVSGGACGSISYLLCLFLQELHSRAGSSGIFRDTVVLAAVCLIVCAIHTLRKHEIDMYTFLAHLLAVCLNVLLFNSPVVFLIATCNAAIILVKGLKSRLVKQCIVAAGLLLACCGNFITSYLCGVLQFLGIAVTEYEKSFMFTGAVVTGWAAMLVLIVTLVYDWIGLVKKIHSLAGAE